jgi:hypothetical protein
MTFTVTHSPALRERVSITWFVHGEPDYLDGWVVAVDAHSITITASPDDDGRDNYDRDMHMRASFNRRHIIIHRFGDTK